MPGKRNRTVSERFWEKVERTDSCWIWTAHRYPSGYGAFGVGGRGGNTYAHRVAYELTHGPIPEGRQIDHICRNRACVRPDHLEAVTPAENTRRGAVAKLTADEVRAIRRDGRSDRRVAAVYGVSRSAIRGIRQRTRWKDVL